MDIKQQLIKCIGSQAEIARQLGLTRGAVNMWDKIPAKHVLKLEELTQSQVTRHQMRPDIFGPEAQ